MGTSSLELGLGDGGDGGQPDDDGGWLRVQCPPRGVSAPRSVRLGGERSQQIPVEAHVVRQDCDVGVLGRLQAVRMPVEGAGQPVQLVNIRASISTPTPLPAPAAGGPPAPPHPQRAR